MNQESMQVDNYIPITLHVQEISGAFGVETFLVYKYKILERCFEIFIKLNQMNEKKTFEGIEVYRLTKTVFKSNLYKCMFLILGFEMRCLFNGNVNFFPVSR